MSNLKANEVIEVVEALRMEQPIVALRNDITTRLRQHAMTDVIWVPDYLTASGKSVIMNSPRIAELARQVGAVMASYTTTTTVVPGKPEFQKQADEAEKAYSLRRADLFTPQVVAAARWRQMVVAYDFYKLVCGGKDEKNPWSVLQPDPLSCYFLMGEESRRSMRPSLMAREYQVRTRDTKRFANKREGKQPVLKNGVWDWEKIDQETWALNQPGIPLSTPVSVAGQFTLRTFYEYDDSETTYIIAMNDIGKLGPTGAKGEILWKRDNLTGGNSYVMVPGYMTGSVELREKFLPHLWGPMNIQYQIDVINTLRASRSMNMKPQVLIERSPELLKAAQSLGVLRPTGDGYESLGADTIMDLDGKPHFWVLPEDKDLAALEASKQAELEAYIATELSLTHANILKEAAVRNIQLALGIRSQQQGPMLSYEAIGEREILKMWAHSITCEGGYGADDWGLFATATSQFNGGYVKPGEYITANKGLLDFEHHVEVETASMSDQERQFLVQAAIERKMSHLSTWPEVLDAAGYANRQEQMENLIDEEGYEGSAQYYAPWLEPVFRQRMAERQGILIPSPAALQAGADQANPANLQGQPNQFPVPQTQSVAGGTGSGSAP